MRQGFSRALATTALIAQAAAAHAEDKPVYAVVRMSSSIGDDEMIGVKRAGLACLPNGGLRWKEMPTGSNMDQRELVQDVLEDAEIPVTPLGEYVGAGQDEHVMRLRGTARMAAFRLCAKYWGLGGASAMSGDAALEIEWRMESRAAAGVERRHVSRIVRRFTPAEGATLSSLYRTLLKEAALDLAAWVKAGALSDPAHEVTSRSTR